MGSLVKCRACGYRCGERPVGVYWRWMRADGVWKKYYARVCTGCYAAKVLPLDVSWGEVDRLACPACGIDTEDDYDGIYTVSFPGNRGQVNTDSPFCGVHAAEYRSWVIGFAADSDDSVGLSEPHRESAAASRSSNPAGLRVA